MILCTDARQNISLPEIHLYNKHDIYVIVTWKPYSHASILKD